MRSQLCRKEGLLGKVGKLKEADEESANALSCRCSARAKPAKGKGGGEVHEMVTLLVCHRSPSRQGRLCKCKSAIASDRQPHTSLSADIPRLRN